MANVYKNAKVDLTTTDNTTIYTAPSNSRAIIKNILISDDSGSGDSINVTLTDASAAIFSLFKTKTIGANATIVCGVKLGSHSFIAAGAVVRNDVKEFALLAGVPAKQIGWISIFGERINLPLVGEGEWQCPHNGETYVLENNYVWINNSNQ